MPRTDSRRAFRTPAGFRAWLARHHADTAELMVRCYKAGAAARGMTYPQALDEALCFGWIDGVRQSVDEISFSTRFTPRRPNSIWSRVNLKRAEALRDAGRMTPPGLAALEARDESRTGVYSFERDAVELAPAYRKRFRAEKAAWTYFEGEAPWYRRLTAFFVMSAKREETRLRRLELLIACSRQGRRIPAAARDPK